MKNNILNDDNNIQSLSKIIETKIKNMIFDEKIYPPNTKLPTERELANQFAVSRNCVREAIKSLAGSGILTIKKSVGTFVNDTPGMIEDPLGLKLLDHDKKTLLTWIDARLSIEPSIMHLIVKNATAEEINSLRKILENKKKNIEDGGEFLFIDRDFHMELASLTHNSIIIRMLNALFDEQYFKIIANSVFEKDPKLRTNAVVNHDIIIQFVEMRDGVGAELAMRNHLMTSKRVLKLS